MKFPFYIAKRYLFSKKKHNAINIISGISVCGVALTTMALVCTLSVFNGFHDLVANFFTAFDPQLKVVPTQSKVFDSTDSKILKLMDFPEISVATKTLEEHAMVQYKDRQAMAIIKGVDSNFQQLVDIDSILYGRGKFLLKDKVVNYGVMGGELVSKLGTGLKFVDPLKIYMPKREGRVNIGNPTSSFKVDYLFSPGVIFAVRQQKYDSQYILTSLDFAQNILDYSTEISSLELKLKSDVDVDDFREKIQSFLGKDYQVLDRYMQQADIFKIMKIEKLMSFIFLSFILLIACFNIVGSLSMLILDKRDDVSTLRNLGADNNSIFKIFLLEGLLISSLGAFFGLFLGAGMCFAQEYFGFISFGDISGSFLVDAYPVKVHFQDIVLIALTVVLVGFLSVWLPVRSLCSRLLH